MDPHSDVYSCRYTQREDADRDKDRKKTDEGEQGEYGVEQDKGKTR